MQTRFKVLRFQHCDCASLLLLTGDVTEFQAPAGDNQ